MAVNLFAFIGGDDLRKQEELEGAVARWLGEAAGDGLNRQLYFGEELRWEQVAEAYQAVSLFGGAQALVIKNMDKAPLAAQKQLAKVFRGENPSTAVFLTAEKLDARSELKKVLAERGDLREFKLPYPNQIPAWLSARCLARYGRALTAANAALLQELAGDDPEGLDAELEKLDTFLPKGQAVDAAAIENVIGAHRNLDIFALQKHMGLRDRGAALLTLRSLLDQGEPPFQIALRLFSHGLTLLRVRTLSDAGLGPARIAEELKLNEFFHFRRLQYLEQSRSRGPALWKKVLARLAKLEMEFKQGKYPQRFEAEMALAAVLA